MSFPIQMVPAADLSPTATPRPIMFDIKDKSQLYSFYMPFLQNGGLFIPSQQYQAPGSKAMILLTLPGDPIKKTITGKVCWVTPQGAQMGVAAGLGIQFDDNDASRLVCAQIEKSLAGILGKSETRTQTI